MGLVGPNPVTRRVPKTARRTTRQWHAKLTMAAEAEYLPVSENGSGLALWPWAGLLTLVGTPDDSHALEVRRSLGKMLFAEGRSRHWADAAEKIPATAEAVVALARVVDAYERVAVDGDLCPFRRARKLRLPDVVEGMLLASSAPVEYVAAAERAWCQHPNVVFSQDMRDQLSGQLRGLLGRHAGLKTDDDDSHIPRV